MVDRQSRALQRHAVAGCAFPDTASGFEQHHVSPAPAQAGRGSGAGDTAADHRDTRRPGRQAGRAALTGAADHLPLASVAGNPFDRETGRLEIAAHTACRGEACQRPAGAGEPRHMGHDILGPHGRIAGRRETVKEPAIRREIQRREDCAYLAVMKMQRQASFTQPDKVISRPARRHGGAKRPCLHGKLGERSMGLFHLFRCQGKSLERDIVEMKVRVAVQFRHHGKKIETGPEPGFRNGEM